MVLYKIGDDITPFDGNCSVADPDPNPDPDPPDPDPLVRGMDPDPSNIKQK